MTELIEYADSRIAEAKACLNEVVYKLSQVQEVVETFVHHHQPEQQSGYKHAVRFEFLSSHSTTPLRSKVNRRKPKYTPDNIRPVGTEQAEDVVKCLTSMKKDGKNGGFLNLFPCATETFIEEDQEE